MDRAVTMALTKKVPAIFVDRDGVINAKLPEDCYVATYTEFRFLPRAIEGLAVLKSLGFLVVVVTNQRGIGRSFMTHEDLSAVHEAMREDLDKHGVHLDGIYYCPHDKHEGCDCRKPRPGLILRASRDLDIDLERSYMVGDSDSDVAAGKTANTVTVRIGETADKNADMIFPSLWDFADYLRQNPRH